MKMPDGSIISLFYLTLLQDISTKSVPKKKIYYKRWWWTSAQEDSTAVVCNKIEGKICEYFLLDSAEAEKHYLTFQNSVIITYIFFDKSKQFT